MKKSAFLFLCSVLPLLACAARENVALGKPVAFLPKAPDYALCSDPDDARQLTDGEYVTAPGQMWIHKGCVGWKNGGNRMFGVKLDLGADTPISGFSWNVGSGSAGVAFPQSVFVYVSLDGVNWAFAGDLLGKALTLRPMPAPGTYSTYKAWTDDLPCHGRWVMFIVQQSRYAFVDEIEVYRGPDELLKKPFPETTTTDPIASGQAVRFRLRMLEDAKKSGAAQDPQIRRRIDELDFEAQIKDAQAILPLNDLHAEIYAANAANLRAAGFAKPVFWTNNRWANLDPLTVPPAAAVSDEPILIRTMRGEVRSAAVNVLNPTDRPLDCRVSVEGLPEGTEIELSEVVFTDTAWFRPVAGALKAGGDGAVTFTIPAGISKQVWIKSVRPTGAAGVRTGCVRAQLSDGSELTRPLVIHVYDLDYPKEPRLQVGGWDYLNNPNYYRNPGAVASKVALHRDMGVNVEWATGGVRPTGETFDAAGHLVSALDFSKWDDWTRNVVPGFPTYAVFLALGKSFDGEAIGTERFKTMAKEYFATWGAHVRATMRPEQRVLVQVVDEPRNAEQANVAIEWMRAVKSAGCAAFVTYMDPLFPDGFDAKINPAFWDLCDIVCPQGISAAKAAEFRAKRQDVYLYACIGPSRTFDPQSYYRLPVWRVFALGGKGMFYWAFGCGGGIGDSWRAYAQKGTEYSPYFVSSEDATPAKQSEAIRESIEDFEYLSMLAERCGADKAEKAVRYVLDNYPTSDPDWDNPALTEGNRNLMDEMCGAILRQLEKRPPRRKMLAIGDSITAAGIWQKRTGELLGMDVRSHCKGGIDAVGMVDWKGDAPPEYDPDDFGVKELYNLSVRDVADVDLIFIMGFYNEVGRIYTDEIRGVATDLYPRQNTFCGRVNYALRRIRETLAAAKNNKARIILVSPHRYGTNCWVDRTSYEVADLWLSALKSVAERNGIPFVDLLNGGGIGRENWNRYQRSRTALDVRYLPADGSANAGTNCPFATLAAAPDPATCKGRLITVRGERGHYASNGKVWKKESAPYPWFADQLHLNADGYRLLGEAIAREVKRILPDVNTTVDPGLWYADAKFGMFVHWGLYSIPGQGEWVMSRNGLSEDEYHALVEKWNPAVGAEESWVKLAAASGVRYMIFTTRHHDGFALFDSKANDFNAMHSPAKRDHVRAYVEACRKYGMKIGFYYSLVDWRYEKTDHERMKRQAWAEVEQLMTEYGKIDILWYDGGWLPKGVQGEKADFWRAKELNARVRAWQPGILINDRAGTKEDIQTIEGRNIPRPPEGAKFWEACLTLQDDDWSFWGHCRHTAFRKTPEQIVCQLLHCLEVGGNLIVNVGPAADGAIDGWQRDLFGRVGSWVNRHADAVYGTRATDVATRHTIAHGWTGNSVGFFTGKGDGYKLYFHAWPGTETSFPIFKRAVKSVRLDGCPVPFCWNEKTQRLDLKGLPENPPDSICTVLDVAVD